MVLCDDCLSFHKTLAIYYIIPTADQTINNTDAIWFLCKYHYIESKKRDYYYIEIGSIKKLKLKELEKSPERVSI